MMKCYKLANLCIGFNCEYEIENSQFYGEFYTNEKPDVIVNVYKSDLPEISGEPIYYDNFYIYYKQSDKFCIYKKGLMVDSDFIMCRISDAENTDIYIDPSKELNDDIVFEALNLADFLSSRGYFILHSSYINRNGEAIIFCGDKGVGKSTQAELWNKYKNTEIINGDRSLLFMENNVIKAGGIPYCGSSKISINRILPVKAIVMLEKGNENLICDMGNKAKFLNLLNKFSYNKFDIHCLSKTVDLCSEICENIPVIKIKCRADKSSVDFLECELCKK